MITYHIWARAKGCNPITTGHDRLSTGYKYSKILHDRNRDRSLTSVTVTDGPVITGSGQVRSRLFSGHSDLTCKH